MKTGNPPDLPAYVLVGGRSSRMGQDKAMLPLGGVPLAELVSQRVSAVSSSVTWIGDPEVYTSLGRRVIPDHFPGCGPLAGIHSALSDTGSDWNLIAACDMPDIDTVALAQLIEQRRDDADCIVPTDSEGRAQPLLALYHRRCLPAVNFALQSGTRKVTRALQSLRVNQFRAVSQSFRNVNTPEEWRGFLNTHV